MVHIFQPKLINNLYGDPGVYVNIYGRSEAYLFDLGDISRLSNKNILKIKRIFISHTHMDHFFGFDKILRIFLGKDKKIEIYGPKGIIENISGKLKGYTWNLVKNYKSNFEIVVYELTTKTIREVIFKCNKKFRKYEKGRNFLKNNEIIVEKDHIVKFVILDHKIDSIGYILEEKFHINILKDKLIEYNFPQNKWLSELKNDIYSNNLKKKYHINGVDYSVKELMKKITKITPGNKIVYLTDFVFSKKNIKKLKKFLPSEVNIFFIEATFLNKEKERARKRFHLTARQAGYIAFKLTRAKKVIPFHISPIHKGEAQKIKQELYSFK